MHVLKYIGWQPECATAQSANTSRLLPTTQTMAVFSTEEGLSCLPTYVGQGDAVRQQTRVRIIADAIWEKGVFATQVTLWENGCIKQCQGLIHGCPMQGEDPAYTKEATIRQALLAVEKWIKTQNGSQMQHFALESVDYRALYHIQTWLDKGRASLESPLASDILLTINRISDIYSGKVLMNPLLLPEPDDEEARPNLYHESVKLLAEHYK